MLWTNTWAITTPPPIFFCTHGYDHNFATDIPPGQSIIVSWAIGRRVHYVVHVSKYGVPHLSTYFICSSALLYGLLHCSVCCSPACGLHCNKKSRMCTRRINEYRETAKRLPGHIAHNSVQLPSDASVLHKISKT